MQLNNELMKWNTDLKNTFHRTKEIENIEQNLIRTSPWISCVSHSITTQRCFYSSCGSIPRSGTSICRKCSHLFKKKKRRRKRKSPLWESKGRYFWLNLQKERRFRMGKMFVDMWLIILQKWWRTQILRFRKPNKF